MAMACPKCNGFYEHQLECPTCGVRLQMNARGPHADGDLNGSGEGWQHSFLGRVIFGLLLAQGLALGFRMFVDLGITSLVNEGPANAWITLYNLILTQVVQALCLVVACCLAGAGQHRALGIGAVVGFFNAAVLLGFQIAQKQPLNEVVIYGQPILHAFIGAVGAFLGSLIWRPLPTISLAPVGIKKAARPSRTVELFGGPIAWVRVLLGTTIVVVGVLSPTLVLEFFLYHGRGHLHISSHMQSTLITWEIIGLAILLGSGVSGFNTFNGPKQGLCVGIASSFLIAGFQLSSPKLGLEEIVFTIFVIVTLSLVGSWFSCRLFPPVVNLRRRRISEAP